MFLSIIYGSVHIVSKKMIWIQNHSRNPKSFCIKKITIHDSHIIGKSERSQPSASTSLNAKIKITDSREQNKKETKNHQKSNLPICYFINPNPKEIPPIHSTSLVVYIKNKKIDKWSYRWRVDYLVLNWSDVDENWEATDAIGLPVTLTLGFSFELVFAEGIWNFDWEGRVTRRRGCLA